MVAAVAAAASVDLSRWMVLSFAALVTLRVAVAAAVGW